MKASQMYVNGVLPEVIGPKQNTLMLEAPNQAYCSGWQSSCHLDSSRLSTQRLNIKIHRWPPDVVRKLQKALASREASRPLPLLRHQRGCQKHTTPVVRGAGACTLIWSDCEQSLIRVRRGAGGGGWGDEISQASRTAADRAVHNNGFSRCVVTDVLPVWTWF